MSAHPPSLPLRLVLAVLLVASAAWTGPLAARRERGDSKAGCIVARAAVLRTPAARDVPDLPLLSAALPSEGAPRPSPSVAAASDASPAGGIAPARPGTLAPSARAPPLPA